MWFIRGEYYITAPTLKSPYKRYTAFYEMADEQQS